jgi:hypothetical protein
VDLSFEKLDEFVVTDVIEIGKTRNSQERCFLRPQEEEAPFLHGVNGVESIDHVHDSQFQELCAVIAHWNGFCHPYEVTLPSSSNK